MTALISKLNITTLFIYIWHGRNGLDVLNIAMHTEVVIHSMNAYVGCWSTIVKVKLLMNSNRTLTVLNLHQKQTQRCNKILKVKVTTKRSKVKPRSHHDAVHPTIPNQCPYQASTSYTLWFPRYGPDKIFILKVTTARSKVKSRSDHNVAYLHILTNVPTKYQLSKPYGF